MDDLCRVCKISKPSLYNLYGSKEEIFLLSFEAYNKKFVAELVGALLTETDVRKGVRALLTTAAERFDGESKLPSGCLAITGLVEVKGASKKIDAKIKSFQKEFLATLSDYFVAKGPKIGERKAQQLAQFTTGQLYALAVFSRTSVELFDLKGFVDMAVAALENLH